MLGARLPSLRRLVDRLRGDSGGVSVIEFALILPVFVALGLAGSEVAYMASVNMQVSQVALSLGDNASRLGQTDNSSVTPTVTEQDIDSIMSGALRQGASFDLETRGRVILSSLEYDDATGKQFIHWQRCRGDLDRPSAYGDDGENNGLNGTEITGVGQSDQLITATSGTAVMVAEVYYDYEPLFADVLDKGATRFRQEAIFTIRDDRNLTPGITGSSGDSEC